MAEATPWFPAGTIHVGVVDPGVGTSRRLVYARIGDQQYLAPDNGLLSLLAHRTRPARIVELSNVDYWMPTVSHTFHGRDILAPVAAQLSLGLGTRALGPAVARAADARLARAEAKPKPHRRRRPLDRSLRQSDHEYSRQHACRLQKRSKCPRDRPLQKTFTASRTPTAITSLKSLWRWSAPAAIWKSPSSTAARRNR